MDATHLHLALNHAPLFAVLFGAAGLGYAVAFKADATARFGLLLLVVAGLLAVPVYVSGEETEDAVEGLPGVSEAIIERHEDAALVAAVGAGVLGLLALGGLFAFRRGAVPRAFTLAVLVVALGLAGWIAYTANLGGQIRHTEIRDGAATVGREIPARLRSYDDDD